MIKNTLFILLCTLTIIGCSVREKPVFVKVEKLELLEMRSDTLVVKADVYFLNPNDIGGTLKSDGIDVYVNDIQMGAVVSEAFAVPAKDEFQIPLTAKIPTRAVFEKNKDGILGGVLNTLLTQKIAVRYKGSITYSALGFSYDYPIDIAQDIRIKN